MKLRKNWKRFWTLDRHHAEGFTLVELIVVIAILAILGGVAIPAYSGYVTKAERAGDEQLLAAVNTAFAAACATNGTDNYNVKTIPTFDVDTMTLDHEYKDDFDVFFAGNEGTFKVFPALYYSKAVGAFDVMPDEIATLIDKLKETYPDAIDDVVNSIFDTIGYDVLAGQIDNAANLLAGFVGMESSGFHILLTGDDNYETVYGYLSDDPDEAEEIYDNMIAKKLEQINNDPAYAGWSDTEKYDFAEGQILANGAILTAAKNSNAITSEFIDSLGNGNAEALLKGATSGGNASSDTIAQAAFAYAMYTSYKASIGENVSGDVNIGDVYETLGTEGFMNYMKNDSAADQAGYHGAMELITGSANSVDKSTAADILLNGFNSDDLVGLMQNVTK